MKQSCTVAPTSIHCKLEHPKGVASTLVQGDWTYLHEISPAQRQTLTDLAHSFNEVPEQVHTAGKATNNPVKKVRFARENNRRMRILFPTGKGTLAGLLQSKSPPNRNHRLAYGVSDF